MFCMLKKEKIYHAYISKHNSNCEKQVILLMISNGEKCEAKPEGCEGTSEGGQWHCLAVKKLSALLKGIPSKNNGDFYCFNCPHSFRTKNKLESHKKVCTNKHFCNITIPSGDTKILEFNQYQKSDKAPFIVYTDLKCITEKIDGCKNNPENLSTTKVSKRIPSGLQYVYNTVI